MRITSHLNLLPIITLQTVLPADHWYSRISGQLVGVLTIICFQICFRFCLVFTISTTAEEGLRGVDADTGTIKLEIWKAQYRGQVKANYAIRDFPDDDVPGSHNKKGIRGVR
jgi:hypothetical protein